MIKKWVCAFFALILVAAIGCSPQSEGASPGTTPSEFEIISDIVSDPNNATEDLQIQYYPSELPEGERVLKCVLINKGERFTEDGVAAFNEKLKEKGLDHQVQFINIVGDSKQALAAFETDFAQEADLLAATGVADELMNQNVYLPLEDWAGLGDVDFIEDIAITDEDWLHASAGGRVYGLPTGIIYASGPGWSVRREVVEDYGIALESFQKSFWELGDVFQTIYSKNGGIPFIMYDNGIVGSGTRSGRMSSFPRTLFYMQYHYEFVTSAVGVDWQGEPRSIVNVYDTKYMEQTVQAWQEYYNQGFLFDSSLQSNYDVSFDQTMVYSLTPAKMTGWENPEDVVYLVPAGKTYISSGTIAPSGFLGICGASSKQQQALDFLRQLYTQQDLKNLLAFGVEGENYTLSDGEMTPNEENRFDGGRLVYGYEFAPFKLRQNEFLMPSRDGKSTREAYQEDIRQAIPNEYPHIKWDLSKVQKEVEQTEKVMKEDGAAFVKHMKAGTLEQWLEQLRERLKQAGVDSIVEELNLQAKNWKG